MYTLFRLPFFFFFNELFFPPHLYKFSLSIKEYPSRRVKIRTNPPRILSVSIRNCRRRRIRSRIMQSSRESTRRPETPSIILISSTGLDDPDTSFSKSRRLEIRGSTPEVEVGGEGGITRAQENKAATHFSRPSDATCLLDLIRAE